MFTGIIQEIGTIASLVQNGRTITLSINAKKILIDIENGDSIAINGVCLTVTKFDNSVFFVDVMPETFSATNLSKLKINDKVNLESALRFGSKVGGHLVSGHVDTTGTIINRSQDENALKIDIQIAQSIIKYCPLKGSIAVDGTSLTIFKVAANVVQISLIPHTLSHTILGNKQINDTVNIECDTLIKYVDAVVNKTSTNSSIDYEALQMNGFLV